MRTLILTLLLLFMTVTTPWADSSIRDGDGNVIATKDKIGDSTIVRGPAGNTLWTEDRDGDQIIIRDQTGNIIATEDND